MTRRQAVIGIVTAAAIVYGKEDVTKAGQREMVLPLDGMIGIKIRYRGQEITLPADAIMAALSGKES